MPTLLAETFAFHGEGILSRYMEGPKLGRRPTVKSL